MRPRHSLRRAPVTAAKVNSSRQTPRAAASGEAAECARPPSRADSLFLAQGLALVVYRVRVGDTVVVAAGVLLAAR